jgi:large subunit ribosomal protein L15
MKLELLPKDMNKKPNKIVGRGHASGKGKTSGRGVKGQKARERIQPTFEGGQLRTVKKMPMLKGIGNNKAEQSIAVNLDDLAFLKKGQKVNVETLITAGIISSSEAKKRKIKILGQGELKTALVVELPTSKEAAKKILAAGGQILENSNSSS